MTQGFRWCPHCKGPHNLSDRTCTATGESLEAKMHRNGVGRVTSTLIGLLLDGKYRIDRLIGQGGMGQVFEAEDIARKRPVAVKVAATAENSDARIRLEREAHLVRAIKHPNICDVLDVGRMPGGAPYVVFERLFGQTLAERVRGHRLPLRATIHIFSQMLSGLQAAHDAGIVHRELKPENVFIVDREGAEPLVKILDFGFARDMSMAAASRITRPGRVCGTMQYMSPEQLRVEATDQRSDLFSVGIILYEVLTGRHPFAASSVVEIQMNILRSSPPPLRDRRPDVPPQLEKVIGWALSRSPSDRPSSARELQRTLLAVEEASLPKLEDDDPVSVTEPVWRPRASSPSA